MCREAQIDEGELLRLRIVDGNLAATLVDGKRLGRRVVRAFPAEGGRLVRPNYLGGPDTPLAVHRKAVRLGPARPLHHVSPIGRWRQHRRWHSRRAGIPNLQGEIRGNVSVWV